jgi:PHP family Zn ribbon phosphoesterase
MQQILDLHIHSRYSRACSPQLTLVNIEKTCRLKGIDIIATGDFTYPAWLESIKDELSETQPGSGLYRLKSAPDDRIKFILSTEVALIYKDGDKVRRIHLVIRAPNIKAAEKLHKELDKKYNIRSDGRPILGIKAPALVKLLLQIDPHFLIYPAHIWTPWFAVFGSKSGFNTLEECFHEETPNIYAFETGLSSDPEMNWRLSALDNLTLLSNSDAHGLNNIGREANVMEISAPPTYQKIYDIIREQKQLSPIEAIGAAAPASNASATSDERLGTSRSKASGKLAAIGVEGLKYTIEFYPEEGMYHFDGHRDCAFSCAPEESRRLRDICPICKKPLVIGVLNRVAALADRPIGFKPPRAVPFRKVIELDKIIAEALNIKSRTSLQVQKHYQNLIKHYGSELTILLDVDLDVLKKQADPRIVAGIERSRAGRLVIKPGFDGQYGMVNIFSEADNPNKTAGLF